jgi:hypothetical protein
MSDTPRHLAVLLAILPVLPLGLLAACDPPRPAPPAPTASSDPAPAAPAKPAAPAAPKDDVKISKEYWTESGKLKYFYELRKDANGKWKRNGIGRAYFSSGELEREGTYRDGVRVGTWTYFKPDGTVDRVEDRGAGNGKAE